MRQQLLTRCQAKKCFQDLLPALADETSTPFVNREREVCELALHNAYCVSKLTGKSQEISNFYDFKFCFGAQFWGGRQDALGECLCGPTRCVVEARTAGPDRPFSRFALRSHDLNTLFPLLQDFSNAKTVSYNGLGCKSFSRLVRRIARLKPHLFEDFLVDLCCAQENQGKHLFIFFDELSGLSVDALRQLRYSCLDVLVQLDQKGKFRDHFPLLVSSRF